MVVFWYVHKTRIRLEVSNGGLGHGIRPRKTAERGRNENGKGRMLKKPLRRGRGSATREAKTGVKTKARWTSRKVGKRIRGP